MTQEHQNFTPDMRGLIDATEKALALLQSHPDAVAEDMADAEVYLAGMLHFHIARRFKGGDVNRPCFVRDMESFRSWGMPTPNHHYYSAEIAGDGVYRILGTRGNVSDYCFEVLSGLAGDDGVIGERIDALESSRLIREPDGLFELIAGGKPVAGN